MIRNSGRAQGPARLRQIGLAGQMVFADGFYKDGVRLSLNSYRPIRADGKTLRQLVARQRNCRTHLATCASGLERRRCTVCAEAKSSFVLRMASLSPLASDNRTAARLFFSSCSEPSKQLPRLAAASFPSRRAKFRPEGGRGSFLITGRLP